MIRQIEQEEKCMGKNVKDRAVSNNFGSTLRYYREKKV